MPRMPLLVALLLQATEPREPHQSFTVDAGGPIVIGLLLLAGTPFIRKLMKGVH